MQQPQTNPKSHQRARRRRRLRRLLRRGLVLVAAIVVMLGSAYGITRLLEGGDSSTPVVFPEDSPVDAQSAVTLPESDLPYTELTPWTTVGPAAQDPAHMRLLTPDYETISLPENGRVDLRYFNTAVFVGDSITQGFIDYSRLTNANFCAYIGATPKSIYDGSLLTRGDKVQEAPLDALTAYQPENVYVLLGTNAMVSMEDDALLTYYNNMLDAMIERLDPSVDIYVQSITPVLQGVDARFDKDRISSLNNHLAQMAWEKGLYFLNLHEFLAGEDGWILPEYGASKDGYHLNPGAYTAWVEYLVTHTAYNSRHAQFYLEGSPYYTQQT